MGSICACEVWAGIILSVNKLQDSAAVANDFPEAATTAAASAQLGLLKRIILLKVPSML
jgi:hypothetical protein